MRYSIPACLLAGCLAACASPTASDTDLLRVEALAPNLSVQNLVSVPVYTFIVNRETLALLDWVPCTNPEDCPGVAPGERRSIPYSEIYGYTPGTRQIMVYHWRLSPRVGGGFRVDSIRALEFTLP